MTIEISIRRSFAGRVLAGLITFEVLLVAIYVACEIAKYTAGFESPVFAMFNLNREANLPSWFSSAQLLCVGLLALVIASQCRPGDRPSRWLFVLAGLTAVFLSFDEASWFHERLSEFLKRFDAFPRFSDDRGLWIFVYVPALVIVLIATRQQIIALSRSYRTEFFLLLAGAIIFGAGAVGLEIFGYEAYPENKAQLGYSFEVAGEEFLEMLGVSIALYALFRILLRVTRPEKGPNRPSSQTAHGP